MLFCKTDNDSSQFYSIMQFMNCFYVQNLNNPMRPAGNSCISDVLIGEGSQEYLSLGWD